MPTTATLKIRNGIPGATVLIDGNEIGVIPADGRFSESNIEPGPHRVTTRKDLYRTRESTRQFEANAIVEVDGLLESGLGTVQIEVSPAEAQPGLSLRREGESNDRAIVDSSLQLEAGIYTVTAVAKGFEEYGATIRLRANESKRVRLELQPLRCQQASRPAIQLTDWAEAGGWRRDGGLLTRAGGGIILAPVDGGPGVYEFSAELRRGRCLEWVVHHIDSNHLCFVSNWQEVFPSYRGRERPQVETLQDPALLALERFHSGAGRSRIGLDGAPPATRRRVGGDRSLGPRGAKFTEGRFRFHIPRRDRIAL